jgi:hypothetical protein
MSAEPTPAQSMRKVIEAMRRLEASVKGLGDKVASMGRLACGIWIRVRDENYRQALHTRTTARIQANSERNPLGGPARRRTR